MISLKQLAFLLVAFTWFEGAIIFGHRVIILYGLFLGGIWILFNLKKISKGDIAFTKDQFYFLAGLLFFLFWGLFSLSWGEITQVAKERAFYIIGAVGFTIILLDQFRDEKDWITAYKILVITGLVSSILVFIQGYYGMYRAVGFISPDPNFTAMRMTALIPLTYFWTKTTRKIHGLFLMGGLLITLLAIISTGSRAGILAGIITLLIISFYELKKKGTKKLLIAFIILFIVGIFLTSIIVPGPLQSGFTRFENLIGVIKGKELPDGSISERYALLVGGARMFLDNFIFGVGLGNFREHSYEYSISLKQESHNTYIEILAELGLVGAIIFFWLIYSTLAKFRLLEKKHSNNSYETFVIGCKISFFSILINFLFLTALTDRRFYLIMAFVVGMLGGKRLPLKEFYNSIRQGLKDFSKPW